MDKKFIYCEDPQTIDLLKQSCELISEFDTGCYFINNQDNVEFDNASILDKVIFTDSFVVEF